MIPTSLKVSQTALFGRLVNDYMDDAPPMVSSGTSCRAMARVLRKHDTATVLVTDGTGQILGIVTGDDVARRIAFRVPPTTSVNEVMSRPVHTIAQHDYLFHAIATMRRHGFRHLPVVDRQGVLTGILHLHKVLAGVISHLLELIDRLTHEATIPGLKQVKDAQVELAEALWDDKVPVLEIQSLLTHINNDIHRRIVERCLTDMSEEGWGEPPARFDVIVMGSGGRGESFLFPDQDNGFVIADYGPEHHTAIDTYFIELAERLTRALHAVGFELCRGNVMATNPLWRKTLSEWREQVIFWVRRRDPSTLRLCDIFFDFRSVYGDGKLARNLREFVSEATPKHNPFLQAMYDLQKDHGVALGPFGRLTPSTMEGPHKGELNLKYHALLPLVESVRLLALREGLPETSTLERIATLHEQKRVLDSNERDYLSGAFSQLTELVLRQQIRDFKAGRPVSTYVSPKALAEREHDLIVGSLKAIKALQARVKSAFSADMV